ncbi:MAG: sigma-70 family RNA polymerase sigma factor, partial [Alphaproteobacteria bacterium]|nr:sigma-70 family RNA polymerase sigma factor [Alphaproteobacteria bacterium]
DWNYEDSERSVELMALLECLDRLDQDHRSAVLLAYYEGYSRDELAEQFGCPVNTVKTWLRRGLQSLRDCLSE